ncbi:MAG: hypothetical protein U1E89_22295 [Burkholderiaceae bacterium]
MLVLVFVLCAVAAWLYYHLAARSQRSTAVRVSWAVMGFVLSFLAQRFVDPLAHAFARSWYRHLLATYSDRVVVAASCLIAGALVLLLGLLLAKLLLRAPSKQ